MIRLSPFRIQMFLQCKQLYKFFYLDGIKQHYVTPKSPIVMGEHVHRALDALYALPVHERSEERLHRLLRESWIRNRACFGEKEQMWGEKALAMLSRYWSSHRGDPDPFVRERYMDMTVHPDLVLLGKIDRVDSEEGGDALHVIDYKTGKERESTHGDALQLLLYTLLVQHEFEKPVARASFWYLATGTVQSVRATEDDLRAAIMEVEEYADRIAVEKEFAPSPNRHCSSCDFRDICPAFRKRG